MCMVLTVQLACDALGVDCILYEYRSHEVVIIPSILITPFAASISFIVTIHQILISVLSPVLLFTPLLRQSLFFLPCFFCLFSCFRSKLRQVFFFVGEQVVC